MNFQSLLKFKFTQNYPRKTFFYHYLSRIQLQSKYLQCLNGDRRKVDDDNTHCSGLPYDMQKKTFFLLILHFFHSHFHYPIENHLAEDKEIYESENLLKGRSEVVHKFKLTI